MSESSLFTTDEKQTPHGELHIIHKFRLNERGLPVFENLVGDAHAEAVYQWMFGGHLITAAEPK